jgi:hypothetical protein
MVPFTCRLKAVRVEETSFPQPVKQIHPFDKENVMGFLEEAEKIAGAVVAVEGVKKLDPNASILTEGAAAVAGFEGAGAIAEHLENKEETNNG